MRPALPLEGVDMILAGRAVWPEVPPSPVLISKPLASGEPDESGRRYPGVFPACAVTHAQSCKLTATDPPAPGCGNQEIPLPVIYLPSLTPAVSREEWVKSQRADSSLSALWDEAVSLKNTRYCSWLLSPGGLTGEKVGAL